MISGCLRAVKDFIFPLRCLLCSCVQDSYICLDCKSKIVFIEQCCRKCGFILVKGSGINDVLCVNCMRNHPIFSTLRSVMLYDDNSKSIIRKFKFHDAVHIRLLCSEWLLSLGKDIWPIIDIIVPVPLHRLRLFARGYNQSSLLANCIAIQTNIKVDHLSLFRSKNTIPQSYLSTVRQKIANTKDAFLIRKNKNIQNKNVVLIDDVVTTGATISSCTKVLLNSGAKSVHILTIARTYKPLIRDCYV